MDVGENRLGILVGGGPAPGINSAISAAAIEAVNSGLEVIGIYDGFEHLMQGRGGMIQPLPISEVSRIHSQGGSILRTSRANPTCNLEDLHRSVRVLQELGLGYLVTIGGDDTAFNAAEVAKAAEGTIRVAHIPNTIDNDIPLPGGCLPSVSRRLAMLATELMFNLRQDSLATNRWVFVVVMGRKAGHLALGMGKAAGATVTIIPEEFPKEHITLNEVCSVLEGAILKRRVMQRNHGVAVIAEGIAERLDSEELANIPGLELEHDPYGHIRLGDIPLGTILKQEVQRRFASRGETISIADVILGYVLRCAPPIPFDIDYTRTLGFGAVRFLLSEPTEERVRQGGLVCLEEGHLSILPFDELRDPTTGRTRIRLVDLESEHYHVARSYMIRLDQKDLEDEEMLAQLSKRVCDNGLNRHQESLV